MIFPILLLFVITLSACSGSAGPLHIPVTPAGTVVGVAVAIEDMTESPEEDERSVTLLEVTNDLLNMPMIFINCSIGPYRAMIEAIFEPGDYLETLKIKLRHPDCGQASPAVKKRL